jgi:hypothetical protein
MSLSTGIIRRSLPCSGLGSSLRLVFQNQPDMELINDVAGGRLIVRLPRK